MFDPEATQPMYPQAPPPPARPEPLIPWGWLRALLMLISFVVFVVVASIILSPFLGELGMVPGQHPSFVALLVAQVFTVLVMWLVVWLFRRFVDRRSMMSLGLQFDASHRRDFAAGILWGIGIISAVFFILWAIGSLTVVSVSFPVTEILLGIVLFLLVGFGEELVMRGYVLNNLMASMNPYLALLFSAIPFALGHALNPNASVAGIINIVFAGLVLGVYYIHRLNLWFPIGIHLSWNYFEGIVYGSPVSGQDMPGILVTERSGNPLITGGDFGFEASLVTAVVILLATFIIHRIYRPSGPADVAGPVGSSGLPPN
jgi:membrane protease YdiL (CAAX protease family)